MSVLSGLALLYSTVIVVLPSIRETILKRRFRFGTPAGVSTVVDKTQVRTLTLHCELRARSPALCTVL